jgi:hypothetical protein
VTINETQGETTMSTDLRNLHPDLPIRWPIRLTPDWRHTLYWLIDLYLLPDWWLSVADGMRLDSLEDAQELLADLSTWPAVGTGEGPEDDIYRTLGRIIENEQRNGPPDQLPWRAP